MKSMKRVWTYILAVTLISSLILSGCQKNPAGQDSDAAVTLRWILAGDKQADSEDVWAAFNEKLKEKLPNTQVAFEIIPFADYSEKWKLISAANESVDMAWHGWVLDFRDEVNKGAYMEISDLIDQYAPKLKESIPEWVWEEQKIDGKLYSFPNYQMMVSRMLGIRTLKANADAYLDKEGIQQAFYENEKALAENAFSGLNPLMPAWSEAVWDKIEAYLEALQRNGKLGLGFSANMLSWLPYNGTNNGVVYIVKDENGRYIAKDAYEDVSKYYNFFERMHRFYQKGYIRKDVLTATDGEYLKENGYIFFIALADDFTEQQEEKKYGAPIHLIKTNSKVRKFGKTSDTNSVIPATASNPVRAMQLYELVNSETDTELYNMLVYGLEGIHYVKTGENAIETMDTKRYGLSAFAVGNTFNAYETQQSVLGYNKYVKNVLHNTENFAPVPDPKLSAFVFDKEPVKGNIAQIESVFGEYKSLNLGVYANWKMRLSQLADKLEKAGKSKVIAEYQRQLDEKLNNQ